MGVWMDMLVAPQMPTLLSREQFCELLQDLLHRGVVQMPCALLAGDVNVEIPLAIANLFLNSRYENGEWIVYPLDYPKGKVIPMDEGSVTIYYYGEDETALFKAIFEAPYGEISLCAWFNNLDFENEDIAQSYTYGADTLVYALPEIRDVYYEVEEQQKQYEHEDGEFAESEREANNTISVLKTQPVQCCFRTTAKGGPYQTCKTMDKIFARHFGNDFIVGCFYS